MKDKKKEQLFDLGGKIKSLREERGISGKDLAKKSGLSERYIIKLETAKNPNPSLKALTGLAKAFVIDISELLPKGLKKKSASIPLFDAKSLQKLSKEIDNSNIDDYMLFKVLNNKLVIADSKSEKAFSKMKIPNNTDVLCRILPPVYQRSYGFMKRAHKLGRLCVENIDDFKFLTYHEAIKRLQVECGAYCKVLKMDSEVFGKTYITIPKSMAFNKMTDEEFKYLIRHLLDFISQKYWPTESVASIEIMLDNMITE